MARIKPKT